MADLIKSKFLEAYYVLNSELLHDPSFEFTDDSRQWVERVIDYNVPGGKLTRGLSVIDSYKLLREGKEPTEKEIFLASALGWFIEWLQAYLLVFDDIEDNSHTRRGHSCWCKVPKVGMIAINDGVVLRSHISRILKNHFRDKPYYVDLIDLFNEVACALLMPGENLDNHVDLKDILVENGDLLSSTGKDDYLDVYGDFQVLGKPGRDIEDFKCSWLVVKALELSNKEQNKILHENYGKSDPTSVAKVKALYNDLDLQGEYNEYERNMYKKLVKSY